MDSGGSVLRAVIAGSSSCLRIGGVSGFEGRREKEKGRRWMVMGAAGSKLEKALGEQFPEGERYFGLENFGNTCYCNSVLQVGDQSPPPLPPSSAAGETPFVRLRDPVVVSPRSSPPPPPPQMKLRTPRYHQAAVIDEPRSQPP